MERKTERQFRREKVICLAAPGRMQVPMDGQKEHLDEFLEEAENSTNCRKFLFPFCLVLLAEEERTLEAENLGLGDEP